jgi:hypothetical protein
VREAVSSLRGELFDLASDLVKRKSVTGDEDDAQQAPLHSSAPSGSKSISSGSTPRSGRTPRSATTAIVSIA